MPGLSESVRRWIEKARHDLFTAEHMLELGSESPFDVVCFHSQQCAEKLLKALLVARQIAFPRTHDLRMLWQLLPADAPLTVDLSEVLQLNRYSVETRYPADWDDFDRAEAEQAVAIARRVRDAVMAHLMPT